MINATRARNIYLRKARKTVAKTIRQAIRERKSFVAISFYARAFETVAPGIKKWLESLGYTIKLNNDEFAMTVYWV